MIRVISIVGCLDRSWRIPGGVQDLAPFVVNLGLLGTLYGNALHTMLSGASVALILPLFNCGDRGSHVPLFSCCLVKDPVQTFPLPLEDHLVSWQIAEGQGPNFGNVAFGDGSGLHVRNHATRRCGWAVVGVRWVGNSSVMDVVAFGPVPGPVQEVPLAESLALIVFLKNCLPGEDGVVTFYTDCKWVITSIEDGELAITHPMKRFAGTWKEFYRVMDDVLADRSLLKIVKVKGHMTWAGCQGDEVLTFRKRGNDLADTFAKRGAGQHPVSEQDLVRIKRCRFIQPILAKFVTRLAIHRRKIFGTNVIPVRPLARRIVSKSTVSEEAFRASSLYAHWTEGHRICLDPSTLRLRCTICMTSADTAATLRKTECKPQGVALMHCLWRLEQFVFCRSCGSYSAVRTLKLGSMCGGSPANKPADERRIRMLAGKHPVANVEIGMPYPVVMWDEWHSQLQELIDGQSPDDLRSELEHEPALIDLLTG